jgi:formylglycine-generating enzyme required for sulfatase activity
MALTVLLISIAACTHSRDNPCDEGGSAFDPTIYGLEARQEFYEMGWVKAVTGDTCGPFVDKWEVSRADATSEYPGKDEESNPRSLAGYLPWTNITFENAKKACDGKSGPYKRLCTKSEFLLACQGGWMKEPDPTADENKPKIYPYGNDYGALMCNGKDFGKGSPLTTGEALKCFNDLGVVFLPTDDKSVRGVFDLSGNVAEWVIDDATGEGLVMGGSYFSEQKALTCTSEEKRDTTKGYADVGFRCCGPNSAIVQ